MSSTPPQSQPRAAREAIVVTVLTVAGGVLRLWSVGRLGLIHFDEGIYAMAGTWVLSPRGLAGLDPTVISYAPPGFPFLVGLAYGLLGVSDISAILVSIILGTLTIPVAGWIAYRTFGPGAGAATSAVAALSGPHIAFSRMALTDASFLLFFLVAIAQGQRFLERPGPARASALGIAVGVAQLFKYNGWLAGAVVVASALVGPLLAVDRSEIPRQRAIWGWGLVAAAIAAVVYSPWFQFVQAHGGYAALLTHHRGYMGGLSSWPGRALTLILQDEALSGGAVWLAVGASVAIVGLHFALGATLDVPLAPARVGLAVAGFTALCAYPESHWFGALIWLRVLNPRARRLIDARAHEFLVIAWIVLALMTPFYHPYARLLLPLQGIGWVLMGGAFAAMQRILDRVSRKSRPMVLGMPRTWVKFALVCGLVPCAFSAMGVDYAAELRVSPLLEPSDSIRTACREIGGDLPKDLGRLRLYGRPPMVFYLSARAPLAPQPTADALFATGDRATWALLDSAMVRQGRDFRTRLTAAADRWDLVRRFPTTMNLPTALDVNPSTVLDGSNDRSAPLLLFRPKQSGAPR